MGGRPRKPMAQKVLQGTFRKDRNPVNEPVISPPKVDTVRPPSSLNKWGKTFWKEHYQQLVDAKILTAADMPAFEMMARSWGEYKQADWDICHGSDGKKRTMAEYRRSREYNRKKMPEVMERKESLEAFNRIASQFGMTPVARNKIDIPQKKETDLLSEMYEETRVKA